MRRAALLLALLVGLTAIPAGQSEKLDYATLGKIRNEGLTRSEVMAHISWLSDVFGPRLTGSPGIAQASEWGLVNAHRESWTFGRGWSLVRFSAHMIEPQVQPIIGVPLSWSPGTKGTVTAPVVRVQIDSDADFAKYRGTLAGKIVLPQPPREVRMLDGPIVLRMAEKDFEEAATVPIPGPRSGRGRGGRGGPASQFRDRVRQLYIDITECGSNSALAA